MSRKDKGPEGQNPLGRWSARKAEARRAADAAPPEPPPEEQPLTAPEGGEGPAAVAIEDLPDIESLGKESDYTGFMAEGVPEPLKRMALRKLWLSDPLLANVDGLVDYGEDFAVAEIMGDAVKTAYRVGKGFLEEGEEIPDDGGEDEETGTDVAAAQPGDSPDGDDDEEDREDQGETDRRDG